MNTTVQERALAIHLGHRHGPARKAARAMIRLTIEALRRVKARLACAK